MTADEVVFWVLLLAVSALVLLCRIRRKATRGEVLEVAVMVICPLLPLVPAVLPVPRRAALLGALLLALLVLVKLRLRTVGGRLPNKPLHRRTPHGPARKVTPAATPRLRPGLLAAVIRSSATLVFAAERQVVRPPESHEACSRTGGSVAALPLPPAAERQYR